MINVNGNVSFSGAVQLKGTNQYVMPRGNVEYTTPGTYTWTVPANVTSISYVLVGGGGLGGAGLNPFAYVSGGYGGGLAYRNTVSVTPGDTITISVGRGGGNRTSYTGSGDYYIPSTSSNINVNGIITIATGGDQYYSSTLGGYPSGTYDGGGYGGPGGSSYHTTAGSGGVGGGGGAAGYSGNGGSGYWGDGLGWTPGSGGGGAGGYGGTLFASAAGGGVGIYGEGPSGSGIGAAAAGSGGSGFYFGGGGNSQRSNYVNGAVSISTGGPGAARIVWGYNRKFPKTNVSDTSSGFDTYIV